MARFPSLEEKRENLEREKTGQQVQSAEHDSQVDETFIHQSVYFDLSHQVAAFDKVFDSMAGAVRIV